MERLIGRCHCGNLVLEFETAMPVGQLQLRGDQCSFCRKHGARTTSDPKGHVGIFARAPGKVVRYRFAQATADFLVCAGCGIYVAAVLAMGDGSAYATVNVNCFDRVHELKQSDPPDRRTRRRRNPRALSCLRPSGNLLPRDKRFSFADSRELGLRTPLSIPFLRPRLPRAATRSCTNCS